MPFQGYIYFWVFHNAYADNTVIFSTNTEVLSPFLGILLPEQKNTHRQCCALGKGFQHRSGECCRHFPQHRTMVSAAVMITSTVTNPTVNQISSLMAVPSFPFDLPGGRRWSWTFQVSALPPPRSFRRYAMRRAQRLGRACPAAYGLCTCPLVWQWQCP